MVRRHSQMLVSISGAVLLKKEGKRWRMNLMSAGQGSSIRGENGDHVDKLIWENRRITVRALSGILNISDGSVKDSHQEQEKKGRKHQCHFSRITPVHTWLLAQVYRANQGDFVEK